MQWFNGLESTVQAAIIIAFGAVLGASINMLSTAFTNLHNRSMKRHEKVLEKRTLDTQELLVKVNQFHDEATEDLFRVYINYQNYKQACITALEKQVFGEDLRESANAIRIHEEELSGRATLRAKWFDNDVSRLTVWLTNPTQIRTDFAKLNDMHFRAVTFMLHVYDQCKSIVNTVKAEVEEKETNEATKQHLESFSRTVGDDTRRAKLEILNKTTSVSQKLIRLLK
jgi:hypothetical protein